MRDYLDTARDALADPKNVDKTLITAQTALVQDSLQKVAALCS
jgi:hypothetical protein